MPIASDPDARARQIAALRPAVKGQILNPNGRRGKLSPLDAIRKALQRPYTPDDPAGPTNLQKAADRLVGLATDGTGSEILAAWNILLKYFEGEPTKPLRVQIHATARRIALETGVDEKWLIAEAERIALDAFDNDEVEQGEEIP